MTFGIQVRGLRVIAMYLCNLILINALGHSAFHLPLTKTSLDSVLPSNEIGWDGGKLTLADLRCFCCCDIQKVSLLFSGFRMTGRLAGKRCCFNLLGEKN